MTDEAKDLLTEKTKAIPPALLRNQDPKTGEVVLGKDGVSPKNRDSGSVPPGMVGTPGGPVPESAFVVTGPPVKVVKKPDPVTTDHFLTETDLSKMSRPEIQDLGNVRGYDMKHQVGTGFTRKSFFEQQSQDKRYKP